MKRKTAANLLMCALSVMMLAGCGSDDAAKADADTARTAEISTETKGAAVGEQEDENAEVVLKELMVSSIGYDSIGGMYEDTVVAMKDDKWGMVKLDGTELVSFAYEQCDFVDKSDGVTILHNEDDEFEYYSFDSEGNDMSPIYGYEDKKLPVNHVSYAKGLWLRGEYGDRGSYYDENGNLLISLDSTGEWGQVSSSGYAVFLKDYWDSDADMTAYIICKEGYRQLNVEGVRPFWTNGKYAWCWDDETSEAYLFTIGTNELVRIPLADSAASYGFVGDLLYIVDGDGMYSLLNTDGTLVTEKKYSYIEGAVDSKKYYLVSEDDNWFYIDCEGNEYGTEFKDAGVFYNGQAIVLDQDGQAYIIDEKFKQVSESVSAESVTSFNKNAYSIKKEDGKYYPAYIE